MSVGYGLGMLGVGLIVIAIVALGLYYFTNTEEEK